MIERTGLQQIKDYFEPIFANLKIELERLYEQGNENTRVIRTIEQQTSNSITSLNKDVERLRSEYISVSGDVSELKRRHADDIEKMVQRWEEQGKINQDVIVIKKFLYAILSVCLGILITFIWSLIINGGIKGLTLGQ